MLYKEISLFSKVTWVFRQEVGIPYSGKVWRGESLANLANRQRFAKLKPSKLVVIIITLWPDLFIHQTFLRQTLKKSKFTKLFAAKLSRYTVLPDCYTSSDRLRILTI